MSTTDNEMVYVAGDASDPEAAWAIHIDDPKDTPELRKLMSKTIADWVQRGANVQRVPIEQGRAMLRKWIDNKRAGSAVEQARKQG